MTVFEAAPQYEPADRQNRFFSGDNYMRAQSMVQDTYGAEKPQHNNATPRE